MFRVREGSYALPDGRAVYFNDGQTLRDVSDLYTILHENHSTGSPNLENEQAKAMLDQVQRGGKLDDTQIGVLVKLMGKYHAQMAALRKSPDREGQDILAVPENGRMIPKGAST